MVLPTSGVVGTVPPTLLQGGPVGSPVGGLLVTVLVLLAVVLVGRIVLAVAWRLLIVAAVVLGVLLLLGLVVPGL